MLSSSSSSSSSSGCIIIINNMNINVIFGIIMCSRCNMPYAACRVLRDVHGVPCVAVQVVFREFTKGGLVKLGLVKGGLAI